MPETELEIAERSPPTSILLEAKSIAGQGVAGRVEVEPDGDGGWRVIVDGRGTRATGPPIDIPQNEWQNAIYLNEEDFEEFVNSEIKQRTPSRKLITSNYGRADAKGYWRVTLNYDDPRR